MDDLQRILELARRWARGGASFDVSGLDGWERPEELSGAELAELFAWVRKRCDAADRDKVAMRGTRELRGPFYRGESVEFTIIERGPRCTASELIDVISTSLDLAAANAGLLIVQAEALSGDGEADAIARVFGDSTGGRR